VIVTGFVGALLSAGADSLIKRHHGSLAGYVCLGFFFYRNHHRPESGLVGEWDIIAPKIFPGATGVGPDETIRLGLLPRCSRPLVAGLCDRLGPGKNCTGLLHSFMSIRLLACARAGFAAFLRQPGKTPFGKRAKWSDLNIRYQPDCELESRKMSKPKLH